MGGLLAALRTPGSPHSPCEIWVHIVSVPTVAAGDPHVVDRPGRLAGPRELTHSITPSRWCSG